MLPADLKPRSFLGPDSISFSEASKLAGCENAWDLSYNVEREDSPKSAAMARGTEMHRLVQHWHMVSSILESEDPVAAWLIKRYVEHFGRLDMGYVELPFAVRLPSRFDGHLFGYFDGYLHEADAEHRGYWLHEIKTMANWEPKMGLLPRDLQVSLYIIAARKSGLDVRGVCFDAIRTHMPARTELPVADSFDRRWITRTDEELEDAWRQLESALIARNDLTIGRRAPLRNLGQACSWCFSKVECLGLGVTILPE